MTIPEPMEPATAARYWSKRDVALIHAPNGYFTMPIDDLAPDIQPIARMGGLIAVSQPL